MSKEIWKCDKCNIGLEEKEGIWITSEDFKPLKNDKFDKNKFTNAVKKFDCLCELCYKEECCEV